MELNEVNLHQRWCFIRVWACVWTFLGNCIPTTVLFNPLPWTAAKDDLVVLVGGGVLDPESSAAIRSISLCAAGSFGVGVVKNESFLSIDEREMSQKQTNGKCEISLQFYWKRKCSTWIVCFFRSMSITIIFLLLFFGYCDLHSFEHEETRKGGSFQNENFFEELLFRPLPDGKVMAHFQLTTQWENENQIISNFYFMPVFLLVQWKIINCFQNLLVK
jgi:hypothetical protein